MIARHHERGLLLPPNDVKDVGAAGTDRTLSIWSDPVTQFLLIEEFPERASADGQVVGRSCDSPRVHPSSVSRALTISDCSASSQGSCKLPAVRLGLSPSINHVKKTGAVGYTPKQLLLLPNAWPDIVTKDGLRTRNEKPCWFDRLERLVLLRRLYEADSRVSAASNTSIVRARESQVLAGARHM